MDIPTNVIGMKLRKIERNKFVSCETVLFDKGHEALLTTLNRAKISGVVGPLGETGDFWADLHTDENTWVDTIKLDRGSWNALKNRWMRCAVESVDDA